MAFSYLELKRIQQSLDANIRFIEQGIAKRERMIAGKAALPPGKSYNVHSLQSSNEDAEDKIISLQTVRAKVRDEMSKLEGKEREAVVSRIKG